MSLFKQFAVASFLTLLIGMVGTAVWVSNRIENGVVNNSALSAALFMDSFIAPLLQGMSSGNQLPENSQQALDQLIEHTPLGAQVLSYKIWGKDGIVVYSSNKNLVGKQFPVTSTLKNAWSGTLQAEYDDLHDEEDLVERALNIPMLEIYSPIRNNVGDVIAVSEFYSNAQQLEKDLFKAGLQSWLLFGLTGLAMFVVLSGIALRGSRTIDSQQNALRTRVAELSDLRSKLQHASRRSTELNEGFLRRVSADLHDGPAQLLAFALLKLEELSSETKTVTDRLAVGVCIREPLQDALAEIRNLSGGLTLPGFEGLSTVEVLEKAANSHERRTAVNIQRKFNQSVTNIDLPESILICAYRFVQETLNNSFQHSQSSEVILSANIDQFQFTVEVSDHGVGFEPEIVDDKSHRLGLVGLRERIESVGGEFKVVSKPDAGTTVTASFNLETQVVESY